MFAGVQVGEAGEGVGFFVDFDVAGVADDGVGDLAAGGIEGEFDDLRFTVDFVGEPSA